MSGPCTPWIAGPDVPCAGAGSSDLDVWAQVASDLLYAWSGRQFAGEGACHSLARPEPSTYCGCWPESRMLAWEGAWDGFSWGFGRCCGQHVVKLAGYPVTEIVEVTIDGAPLDPSAYRLERGCQLIRQDGRTWPNCQRALAPLGSPGTFSIEYRHGAPVPALGIQAAKELACELFKASSGAKCKLPSGVTRITRQGVTIDRLQAAFNAGRVVTGLVTVDAFLGTYNPNGLRRRSAVLSPDTHYARRV